MAFRSDELSRSDLHRLVELRGLRTNANYWSWRCPAILTTSRAGGRGCIMNKTCKILRILLVLGLTPIYASAQHCFSVHVRGRPPVLARCARVSAVACPAVDVEARIVEHNPGSLLADIATTRLLCGREAIRVTMCFFDQGGQVVAFAPVELGANWPSRVECLSQMLESTSALFAPIPESGVVVRGSAYYYSEEYAAFFPLIDSRKAMPRVISCPQSLLLAVFALGEDVQVASRYATFGAIVTLEPVHVDTTRIEIAIPSVDVNRDAVVRLHALMTFGVLFDYDLCMELPILGSPGSHHLTFPKGVIRASFDETEERGMLSPFAIDVEGDGYWFWDLLSFPGQQGRARITLGEFDIGCPIAIESPSVGQAMSISIIPLLAKGPLLTIPVQVARDGVARAVVPQRCVANGTLAMSPQGDILEMIDVKKGTAIVRHFDDDVKECTVRDSSGDAVSWLRTFSEFPGLVVGRVGRAIDGRIEVPNRAYRTYLFGDRFLRQSNPRPQYRKRGRSTFDMGGFLVPEALSSTILVRAHHVSVAEEAIPSPWVSTWGVNCAAQIDFNDKSTSLSVAALDMTKAEVSVFSIAGEIPLYFDGEDVVTPQLLEVERRISVNVPASVDWTTMSGEFEVASGDWAPIQQAGRLAALSEKAVRLVYSLGANGRVRLSIGDRSVTTGPTGDADLDVGTQ